MKRRFFLELIIIIILGFTPLLWFHGNQLILGHDSGLVLSPVSHFVDRLSVWTDRIGFGSDQTYATAGFFIHGLDALISSLGVNIQTVQKIVFIFWFMLPGLTMYYFASKFSRRFDLKYFALPASVFYMFNHFLLQGWFVVERTKFSVYAALPLVMAFLFDWEEGRRSTIKTALFISLTLFILNGEASLPLFGGVILSISVFITFYLIKQFSKERILRILKLLGLTFFISAFLNAYWLFPYVAYLLQFYSNTITFSGGFSGVLSWLDYVSRDSSIINLLRLQGIPEWYLNPFHPYADIFLNNAFFIALSYIVPVAAFLPLYLIKNKKTRKKVLLFSFLALISIIFAAGAHPPFGAIYALLINFIPGFVAFRNPLYKFSPALWFSYAVLIAFTIDYLFRKLEINRKILTYVLHVILSLGIVLYSFPFLTGSFFDYSREPGNELTTRVRVPNYIFDFIKFENLQGRKDMKTLALPPPNLDNKIESYTWGYWGPSPLTTLLTNAPIVNDISYMSSDEISLVEMLYKKMKNNEPGWQNLAKLLGIKSFLLRRDFKWNDKREPTDNPLDYVNALQDTNLELVKKMGEWEIYDFKNTEIPHVKLSSKINYLVGNVTDLAKVSSLPDFNSEEPIYVSSGMSEDSRKVLEMKNSLFLIPPCVSCNLLRTFINVDFYTPLITRDSKLYFLTQINDWLKERKLVSSKQKVRYFLYKTLEDALTLGKFVSERKPEGTLRLQVEGYSESLASLDKALLQYFSSENIDNDFLLEIDDVLRVERATIFKNSDNIYSKNIADFLNEKFELLNKVNEKIDKSIWRTTDETNKKFLVNSNLSQSFKLVYRSDYVATSDASVKFELDDKSYEVLNKPASSGWITLGNFFLSKGLHKLKILQTVENLYKDDPTIQLNSSSDLSCFITNKFKGNKDEVYRISFQHQRLSGSKKFFARVIPSDKKPNPLDRSSVLNPTSVWDYYATDYIFPSKGFFYLTICNYPTLDKEDFTSSIEIKDINIRKITVPEVVFYSASFPLKQIESTVLEKSQTEYSISKVSSRDKEIVTLDEPQNKNWVLDGANNSIKLTANGYSDGWIIRGNQEKIVLKYKLQDLLKLGFFVSGISSVLVLAYLLIYRKK